MKRKREIKSKNTKKIKSYKKVNDPNKRKAKYYRVHDEFESNGPDMFYHYSNAQLKYLETEICMAISAWKDKVKVFYGDWAETELNRHVRFRKGLALHLFEREMLGKSW